MSQILSLADADHTEFNWPEIVKCAQRPLPAAPEGPGGNNMLSGEWRGMEHDWKNITNCRWWLAAYRAGFMAAASDKEYPFPVVPVMQPDDMKTPWKKEP